MDFTALFVGVDDFWRQFRPDYERRMLSGGVRRRRRDGRLSVSEIMTILIAFQTSDFRTFKHFYLHLHAHHRSEFPGLVRYHRFVELMPCAAMPLFGYLMARCIGEVTGVGFIDSTPLRVCSNKRIHRHRTFDGIAARGKSTVGGFHGFKLHLVVNDRGELLAFMLTAGNVDDRKPVPTLVLGKLFGDKGYIGRALFEELHERGVRLVTGLRRNMKNRLMEWEDKILLRKRSLIETINDQLKNICQIEHTRHRSPTNFMIHLFAGLIAYARQPKKPSLRTDPAPTQNPDQPIRLA